MFQSGLVCTDFTDGLYRLVNFVPELAKSGLKKIIFLHSLPVWEQERLTGVDEEKIAQAKERLSDALQNIPDGVEVKIEVLSGRPTDTILRVVDREKVDVIITGTPVRSQIEEKVFGSTTKELAKHTAIPLMIFRPQLISTYTVEELSLRCQHLWRYLLIPYNDTEAAHYLIKQIKAYAASHSGNSRQKCLLLWVTDDKGRDNPIATDRVQQAQQKLEALKGELEALDLEVQTLVRQGNFLEEIVNVAVDFDISAIALATDYRNQILEWAVPSVVNEVLHRLWFPLLLFSPKK